jgi:secreted trypsin-like serine protease
VKSIKTLVWLSVLLTLNGWAFGQQVQVGPFAGPTTLSATETEALARGVNPRIVGGKPIDISKVPWQAALIIGTLAEPGRILTCGGIVVHVKWILTAAHCLAGKTRDDVNVVVNTTYWRYNGNRISVQKLFIDPEFRADTLDGDVGLVQLAAPIPNPRPVSLIRSGVQLPDGAGLSISGWGAVIEGEQPTDMLMAVDVPLVATSVCNAPDVYAGKVTAGMMCAGVREGGVDACQGDSGGPSTAVINGSTTLVGVISWGQGCAQKLKYGVYARVAAYRQWIDQVIAANP